MNRRCLQSQFCFDDDQIFTISTSHLESLEFKELRCRQLDIIFKKHEKHKHMIFCGDTNYGDDSSAEPTHIPNVLFFSYDNSFPPPPLVRMIQKAVYPSTERRPASLRLNNYFDVT